MPRYLVKMRTRTKQLDSVLIPKGAKLKRTSKGYVASKGKKRKVHKGYRLVRAKSEKAAWARGYGIRVTKRKRR